MMVALGFFYFFNLTVKSCASAGWLVQVGLSCASGHFILAFLGDFFVLFMDMGDHSLSCFTNSV